MSQDISNPNSNPPAYGANYVTKIPSLSDDADIQQALALYHFGEESEPTKSMIFHLNRIESNSLSGEMRDINTLGLGNNLDNIITTGFYIQASNAQAQANPSYPAIGAANNERYAGSLKVVATGTTNDTKLVYQEYHMSGTNTSTLTNNVFWRTRFPNSSNQYIWSPWKRLVDTNHTHDDRYYTRSQSFNPDNINDLSALGYTKSQADSKFLTLQTLPSGAPVGSVSMFAADTIPSGWLSCRGQLVSRIEYADLFSVIGVRYGNGDGSTTFAVPNFQARIPVGISETDTDFNTVGKIGGEKNVTLLETQIPSHSHSGNTSNAGGHSHSGNTNQVGDHQHTVNSVGASTSVSAPRSGVASGNTGGTRVTSVSVNLDFASRVSTGSGAHSHSFSTNSEGSHSHSFSTSSVGGGQPHNNVQPYITMNYIIKATP